MTSTTTSYLSVENNLARYQKLEAQKTSVKTATAYYQANIGKVTSASQLVSNYRLLSYALQAYGLGDQINNKALIQKVLAEGASSSSALANTLPNPNWKAFAKAFNFSATGSSAPSSTASQATTAAHYDEEQLETDQGASDPGVQLALYFQRVAPTITNAYGILADKNLLEVVQTIFNLPSTASASQVDKEATEIGKLLPLSDLQNPAKLKTLTERFTAAYDLKYGPASQATSSLTVYDTNTPTTVSAASTILGGVVSSTASALAYLSPSHSGILQGLTLGG